MHVNCMYWILFPVKLPDHLFSFLFRRVMEQLVAEACDEYSCIPLLFSNGAIQEVATLLGADSQQLKRVQALQSVSANEMDLQGVATYTQKFTYPVKTHETGISVFRKVQGAKFEDAGRAKFGVLRVWVIVITHSCSCVSVLRNTGQRLWNRNFLFFLLISDVFARTLFFLGHRGGGRR